MAKTMKALMLHSENSAVGKYRIWQPAKYLQKLGWDIARIPDEPKRIPIDRGYSGDDPVLQQSAKEIGSWEELSEDSDIIVMQRPDQPDSIALALALREQCGAPLVFEVDDNIYDVAESSTSYQYWSPGSPLFKVAEMLMKEADALTVSTPALIDVYKHLNPNIYVLPNYQDLDDWRDLKRSGNGDKLVIGWQGSSTHYDDIQLIGRVVKKILRKYPNISFKMVGFKPDFFVNVPKVELETNFSLIQDFPKRLEKLNFDIGLAPVVDRPFNRAKSNIKWQEYSMLEIPTIASRVGEYLAIEHEQTGLLAYNTEDSWYFQVERLIEDVELRNTLGKQAKQYVESKLTMEMNMGKWDEAYRDIITRYKQK